MALPRSPITIPGNQINDLRLALNDVLLTIKNGSAVNGAENFFPIAGANNKIANTWLNMGAGNGIDADTVDGFETGVLSTANTLALRSASGQLTAENPAAAKEVVNKQYLEAFTASNVSGLSGFRNLSVRPFANSNNAKMRLKADVIQFRNAANATIILAGGAEIIVDQTNWGGSPTLLGRDNVNAYGTAWVHIYFISNGTNISAICTAADPALGYATNPNTGPVLPTGYTYWAYATTVRSTGNLFIPSYTRGTKNFYQSELVTSVNLPDFTTNVALVEQAVVISTLAPSITTSTVVASTVKMKTVFGGDGGTHSWNIGITPGVYSHLITLAGDTGDGDITTTIFDLPWPGYDAVLAAASTVYYLGSRNRVSWRQIYVLGYEIPNGAA